MTMVSGCAPNASYEEMITLLDMIEQTHVDRSAALNEQRNALLLQLSANDKEIATLNNFKQFAQTLRRQVEAGQIPAEAALTELSRPVVQSPASELVSRRFNTSEFVSTLRERGKRKAS